MLQELQRQLSEQMAIPSIIPKPLTSEGGKCIVQIESVIAVKGYIQICNYQECLYTHINTQTHTAAKCIFKLNLSQCGDKSLFLKEMMHSTAWGIPLRTGRAVTLSPAHLSYLCFCKHIQH